MDEQIRQLQKNNQIEKIKRLQKDIGKQTKDLKEEYVNLRRTAWYKNYQIWAAILLVLSAFIWIIF